MGRKKLEGEIPPHVDFKVNGIEGGALLVSISRPRGKDEMKREKIPFWSRFRGQREWRSGRSPSW
jgi:hypothetical protein